MSSGDISLSGDDDDWVGLSTTVSDERTSTGGGSGGAGSSPIFVMRKELRSAGHEWPLSTIVPWRVFYLFAELATDAGVSEGFVWLSQISGLLRAFPTVPGVVYMECLEGLWRRYFGAEATKDVQQMEALVMTVTSHCILRSVRELWTSYPQQGSGQASAADDDDHLSALHCGLRVLQLLTKQAVLVENERRLGHGEIRQECRRQLASQLEASIVEAARGVAMCLESVRNVNYFGADGEDVAGYQSPQVQRTPAMILMAAAEEQVAVQQQQVRFPVSF